MNIGTSSSDGRKTNHHDTSISRSRSPSSGSRSPSSKRRESGPSPGHFGFPPRSGIDAGSPYGSFNPAAIAAMRSIPGYTGLLGTSSPPTIPSVSIANTLPSYGDSASAGPDNIPLALYQSPIWQAAMRQQQMQLLASLGGSANPLLPNPLTSHHHGHQQPQMPPTTSQVQAAVALLAASTHGNGISGGHFPPTAGIRRTDPPVAAPDSSSSDTSTSSSAAALAALIAASASSSAAAAATSTSQADSNVAMKAYHDYLSLTKQLQSEQNREPPGSDKTVKQFFNSISSSDSTITDSLTTSNNTSQAILLMAEQLRRDKHCIPTNTTSAVSTASPITSRSSAESTQAKTSMTTPFNVRPNLSNQENSLKRDLLPPTYSSPHISSSPTSPHYRHPIINAEDAKKLNLQLQQQADFVKLLAEGSPNILQSPSLGIPPSLPQNFIGVRSPEDLLPRSHPSHPHNRSAKPSSRSHQPYQQIGSSIVSSNTSPPSIPMGIGDLLPAVPGPKRRDGRSNRSSESSGGGPPTYNGRDKVFTCKICNRSFGYKHVLQNHERTHTGEKPFECKVCNKRFTRDHHLKTHMRLHTGEKPYNCTHCDRQFVQVANLRRHLRVHTGEKPYKCDLCESRFSDSNQLKAHILIHKGEKPFNCDKCEGSFRRRHHLMHHVCPMTKKSSENQPKIPENLQDEPHQRSPPPLLPLPGHLGHLPQASDMCAPKRGRKKQGYMEGPMGSVSSSPDELYKPQHPFSALGKSPVGQFDEESLKAMLKAATAIGVAAATGVNPVQSSDNSLPHSSLELGLRMLRAAEAESRERSTEYDSHMEEELDSTLTPTSIPDTSMKVGSNGAGTGRSRKSRDPKKVRQSPTNYDDEIDVGDQSLIGIKDEHGKSTSNIPRKRASNDEEDDVDDNHVRRTSIEIEEGLQTEPEDLSSRKNALPLVGLSAAIRVRSRRDLNRMSAPKSPKDIDSRDSLSGTRSHEPTSSLEPGEDDGKDSLVSTTGEQEDEHFEENQNDSHLMEVEDEDEYEDNKGNTSDTGTATTTSTSELATGISGTVLPGASPPSELVAVTATASTASAVGLHVSNVGGNGGNNLPQLSIANN